MKLSDVIARVDDIKPNAFTDATKTAWINECEGLVQTEVMLIAAEDVIQYDYDADAQTELLVKPPHDKIYWAYLSALIDFANGEYNKYQNTMQLFNNYFGEYMRWYALRYRPADGEAVERGYYLSAYAIAVKHGFDGSEEEWLASLKGDTGAQGEKGDKGDSMTSAEVLQIVKDEFPGGIGYVSGTTTAFIYPETELTFSDTGGIYVSTFDSFPTLVEGDIYTVELDGNAYQCECIFYNGITLLGNASILGLSGGEEYPFLITNAEGPMLIAVLTDETTHTLSVSQEVTVYSKIDADYLPVAEGDNYGLVTENEIVKAYNFTYSLADTDLMRAAVSELSQGRASVVWNGMKMVYGSVESDGSVVLQTHDELSLRQYRVADGYYNSTVFEYIHKELSASNIYLHDTTKHARLSYHYTADSSRVADRLQIGVSAVYIGSGASDRLVTDKEIDSATEGLQQQIDELKQTGSGGGGLDVFTISKTGIDTGSNTVTFPTGKERTSTDYIVIPVLRDYVNYSGQIYIQTKNTTGFTFYSTAASVVQTVDFVIID